MNNVDDNFNDPELRQLSELAWRRRLTSQEKARLRSRFAAHPQARADWELETALTDGLNRMPLSPVSSNFTALVLQAVQRPPETARRSWFDSAFWFPAGWRPRLVAGAAMLSLCFLTVSEYQAIQHQRMARNLANVSQFAEVPPLDWLQNFETIDRLNRVKVADEDLLTLLQ